MANLIVELLLKDKDFAGKFKKNKEAVLSFSNVGSSMLGVVGKFAGAFGLAMGGVEAFNKAMNSSQTLADSYGSVMHAAKVSVDNFFYALTSGDFSSFLGGLDAMISRAREAYAALDDLGNVTMSFNYEQARLQAQFQEQINIARDESQPVEVRKKAEETARALGEQLKENARTFSDATRDAYIKQLAARAGIEDESIITREMLDKALGLDIRGNRGELREKNAAQKALYDEELKALNKDLSLKRQVSVVGAGGNVEYRYENTELYYEKLAALQERNAEVLTIFAALELLADEGADGLKTMGAAISASDNALRAAISTDLTLQRVRKGIDKKGSSTSNEVQTPQHNPELADPFSRLGNISSGFTGIADFFAQDEQDKAMKKAREDKRLKDLGIPEQLGEIEVPDVPDIDDKKKGLDDYASAVGNLSSAFGTLGSAIGGTEGALLSWIGTSIQAIASVATTIAQLSAESGAYELEANAAIKAAGGKALAAHSGIPFVGVAMGAAAVATIIATMMSLPKFAEGGVVTGPTVGLVGEAGPEAIIPLAKLERMMAGNSREVRVVGTLRARGKDLVGTIENFNNVKNVR